MRSHRDFLGWAPPPWTPNGLGLIECGQDLFGWLRPRKPWLVHCIAAHTPTAIATALANAITTAIATVTAIASATVTVRRGGRRMDEEEEEG